MKNILVVVTGHGQPSDATLVFSRFNMIDPQVDIKENDIFELSPELLNTLLKDHTVSTDERQVNIFGRLIAMPLVERAIYIPTKSL